MTKRGTAFRRRRRPCSPSNRLQIKICSVYRAPWAPPNHLEFFFSSVWRVNESDQNVGCDHVPFVEYACARAYPAVSTKFEKSPFWHVAGWCAPDWLTNTAGWRLFQLVVVVARRKDYVTSSSSWVVVARRKDYVPRRNNQRPRHAQTQSAYVNSIPQGLVR